MYNVEVVRKDDTTVFIQLRFIDERLNHFIKTVAEYFCKKNKVEQYRGMSYRWANTSRISRFFKRTPYFYAYIAETKYDDMMGIFNTLMQGKEYKLDYNKEAEILANDSEVIIRKFLDDKLKEFILPRLANCYKWGMTKEERQECDSETTPFRTTSMEIALMLGYDKVFEYGEVGESNE
jgi:hypothetical protein